VVTIRNVADKAGVSIGTVSRVLNNKGGVGAETRQRVFDIVQELGYQIPRRSMPLASSVTQLGLLNRPLEDGLMSNPFYHDVFIGVEQACRLNHVSLAFSSLDINAGLLQTPPPLLEHEDLAGLILVGAMSRAVINALLTYVDVPVVLVDNCLPNAEFDSIVIDNGRGVRLAVEHLIDCGHRYISFVSGPDHPSIVERQAAYRLTMQQHQLTPFILTLPDLSLKDGEQAVNRLLKQRPKTTAIICANDMQAIGVVRRLQQLGYHVPTDFSVVGFDDIDLAQVTSPAMTTVKVDRLALGQIATRTLLARIQNPARPIVTTTIGVKLVERDSVAPPRSVRLNTDFESR
jgi:LacI family transcriptional regulator